METITDPSCIDRRFAKTTNLASAALNASILACSNEFFAAAANLLTPAAPVHRPGLFVHSGRLPFDWAIVKLGVRSAVIEGVEIDTRALCPPTTGDKRLCLLHVRLRMYPDGGIARLRLYGHALPPSLPVTITSTPLEELSSALYGALVTAASNQHFTPAANLLLPGRGINMGDGWETARSRRPGHVDWAVVRLALPGSVERIVVDTKDFRGNFPQAVRVHGIACSGPEDPAHDHPDWVEVVSGDRPCRADAEHVFDGDDLAPATRSVTGFTHLKLTMVPDGGIKRFRAFGRRKKNKCKSRRINQVIMASWFFAATSNDKTRRCNNISDHPRP
ncbi:conserved hypothetical protein [Uncinocarpus reesii 1704]|uniref:Allantoicase domain-containing protein n=1 Tax=Uncinocarpus reesii (strain UAMH 1704) TaxID=336963 RepID=C4JYJ6_UNCRE|nr:uncharacterized protein UREG_07247 [Uncinocarpus reesii 1704]EEP82382.1 conserved hypothetical protein [Uncinocarpus reesii 1704]